MHALDIAKLINGYLNHSLTAEESEQLEQWLAAGENRRQLLDELKDEGKQRQALQLIQQFSDQETLRRILARPRLEAKRSRGAFWLKWAAVWLLVAATGFYFYTKRTRRFQNTAGLTASSVQRPSTGMPVGGPAILTLADGRSVPLDTVQKGIVVATGKIRYNNGRPLPGIVLANGLSQKGNSIQASLPELNLRLSTPKGGTYQVTLSDGTRVWLNAATTLKYPSAFPAEKREVELDGEAFFEVKSGTDRGSGFPVSPFIVKTRGQVIRVLGTTFNVSAYADDAAERTTLVNGRVQVGTEVLDPGQKAVQEDGRIRIIKADIEAETAWMNGYFMFDEPLDRVMRSLARWYGLEVRMSPGMEHRTLAGKFARSRDYRQILAYLAELGNFNYSLDGNRVSITKK